LGNGTAGFFVGADKRATPWGYLDGEAWLDLGESAGPRTLSLAKAPHKLSVANPRVAVLTDVGVASSGEAIAIAFRGRPNTRSFGTRTCGLSTAVEQFRLSNGARLAVVIGVMADRTMKAYGGAVEPDESTSDPAQSVARAVAWLRSPR
jgi:C-terminal processing protease CtpA/Prc